MVNEFYIYEVNIAHSVDNMALKNAPTKVFVCKCEQCKHAKNKHKNRKAKKKIKRMLNKKLRKGNVAVINFYWA